MPPAVAYSSVTSRLRSPDNVSGRSRASRASAVVAALLFAGAISQAGAASITGQAADRQVNAAGVIADSSVMHCGYSGVNTVSCVFVFQLPTLPAGKQITGASLRCFQQGSDGTPAYNADLYGIRVSTSSEVRASDAFAGPTDTEAVLIQDNLIVPSDTSGTRSSESKELTEFLNVAYANGEGAGQYVFFRLSPDVVGLPKNFSRFRIYSAEYTGGSYYWPTITYKAGKLEVVPSPAATPAAEAAK